MPEKITFISSSDHAYYPILREWIHSIRQFHASKSLDICILDTGMTDAQISALTPHITKIVKAEWPAQIPKHRIRGREYFKACVNRPFLPELFPGYDLYLWMDADTWVQDWQSVELFLEGARRKKLAVAAQSDRAYRKGMRVEWLPFLPFPIKAKSFYFANARKAFGLKTAQRLFPYHVLSAGVFALHKDAPHWEKWQELIIQALKKGKPFTAEQLTMGMMIHLDNYPAEIMPAWCHWLCEAPLIWNTETQKFIEPYLPHHEIGILHLTGHDKMRIDRSSTINITTQDNKTLHLNYRYPFYDGERDEGISSTSLSESVP